MRQIEIKARAKINLTLDVIGKRPDGYHEVAMVMQTIDLHDLITLTAIAEGIEISANNPEIPLGPENLVYKAVEIIKPAGFSGGIHIHIEKNIPMAAGLAGGSTDAAAVLKGLNSLWRLNLSPEELLELGSRIGSDVPFCILEGTALATGRGEKLTPLAAAPELWLVLAKPPVGVSTKEVYSRFDSGRVGRRPDNAAMIEALAAGDTGKIKDNLVNVLESVTLRLHPEVSALKALLHKAGAEAVLMSGSGPAVFGLAPDQSAAGQIAEQVQREHPEGFVRVVRTWAGSGRKTGAEGE
ncbi:MAG: 4-(cytidine 5'-diphospho)-2-C-methyl-D-erythritol kinase [Bacillota bacterium]